MKYVTEFDETTNICTMRVTGEFKRPDDSLLLRQVFIDLRAERGCRQFLCDMRQAEIKGEWNVATKAIPVHSDPSYNDLKVAMVYSADLSEIKLIESVASSRGHLVTVFTDIDKAAEWLKL